jgi:hypothetical protein
MVVWEYGEMLNSFNSLCDDFYVDMHINTELELPTERDMVLTFFERIQRQFPAMGNFSRRERRELYLEEEKDGERYRWVGLEQDRLCTGCANPTELSDAYDLDELVLDIAPYMLGVSHLDIDSLDVTFAMDFDYRGNHDEVIADAFFGSTPFGGLLDMPGTRAIGFAPTVVVAISDDCRRQVRIAIEPRTTVHEVRNDKFKSGEPISLYFTVRQYPDPYGRFDAKESFKWQCAMAEDLMAEKIIPNFVQPLTNAIAQRRK